jgi:hypothetical protein
LQALRNNLEWGWVGLKEDNMPWSTIKAIGQD